MIRFTLTHDGEQRETVLFPSMARNAPLVIVLHGAGGTPDWADSETGWSARARYAGFAVAYPVGTRPHPEHAPKFLTNPPRWNDGSPGPTGTPPTTDDSAFIAAVINHAIAQHDIDPRRVYLTGFSNGAGMAFRFAAEHAERLAAVAPVAGYCWLPEPNPTRPVPTLFIVGTEDPLIPLRGGDVRSPWLHRLVRRPPIAQTLERWATAIGCAPIPHRVADEDGVCVETYPGPVEFRTIQIAGLGHHWPGGKGQLNPRIAGSPSNRLDATTAIWDFFRQHTL